MPTRSGYWVLLIFFLALGCRTAHGQVSNPDYKPLKLPSGDPFPSSEAELLHMRDKPDGEAIRRMRAHAWDILGGLVAGADPIWDTWYTKCDLYLEVDKCGSGLKQKTPSPRRLLRSLEIPAQSLNSLESLAPDSQAQAVPSGTYREALAKFIADFRAKPQVASVLFDQEAADHITNNCLFPDDNVGQHRKPSDCPPIPIAPGKVATFPKASVVIKAIWAIVGPDQTEITVFSPELWNEIHSAARTSENNPYNFRESMTIDLSPGKPCPGDKIEDKSVPLNCFYHTEPLTKEDLDTIPRGIVHLGSVNNWKVGNSLVLLGLHVTTKEIGDWVWATFWWNKRVTSDWHGNGRPNTLRSAPWNRYLTDTTLSGMTPFEQDGGPKICFNPFLETDANIQHGIISNCLQCHSKAAFGSVPQVDPYKLGVLDRDGQRLASGDHPVPEYFDTMVSTDFIWSIADAQNHRVRKVVMDLQVVAQALK